MIIDHDREKLIQSVLYFAGSVRKLGKTKLFKLLYFLDFEHFKDTGRPVTGLQYFAWKMGPVPRELFEELTGRPGADWGGKVHFSEKQVGEGKPMLVVKPLDAFDPALFSRRELRLLRALSVEYKDALAEEMIEATHLENLPWAKVWQAGGGRQEPIPYELAVRAQEEDTMKRIADDRTEVFRALKFAE